MSVLAVAAGAAWGLEIQIRYDYDTQGFFQQSGSREAIERVAGFYGGMIHDRLLGIDPGGYGGGVSWSAQFTHPGTGATQTIPGLVVPADTLILFVGGRNLSGSTAGTAGPGGWSASGNSGWFNLLRGRGEQGALATPATDFAPWGGQITFDLDPTRTWHFQTNGRPIGSASDFVSIAMHELAHALGFGTCDAWSSRVASGRFNGEISTAAFGGPVPVQSSGGHWQDDAACQYPDGYNPANPLNVLSRTYGSFGRAHGLNQIALMDPSSCRITTQTYLQVFTDLDLAALRDIGWQVVPPAVFASTSVGPKQAAFTWPTTCGVNYSLQRSRDTKAWTTLAGPTPGDGEMDSFIDTAPPPGTACYRLQASSDDPTAQAPALEPAPARALAAPQDDGAPARETSFPERIVDDCGCEAE